LRSAAAPTVAQVRIGLGPEQRLHRLRLILRGSQVQRRQYFRITSAGVRPDLDERPHDPRPPFASGEDRRGDCGIRDLQQLDHVQMLQGRGQTRRGLPCAFNGMIGTRIGFDEIVDTSPEANNNLM
jgi:2-keto-3-deoxy-galactonokinase